MGVTIIISGPVISKCSLEVVVSFSDVEVCPSLVDLSVRVVKLFDNTQSYAIHASLLLM